MEDLGPRNANRDRARVASSGERLVASDSGVPSVLEHRIVACSRFRHLRSREQTGQQ